MAKSIRYSAKGDDGTTCLQGAGRYLKSEYRFEVLGTLDESSAMIGLAKSMISDPEIKGILTHIQRDLYYMMGEISMVSDEHPTFHALDDGNINWLEDQIEILGRQIASPGGFIIPGDTSEDAVLDITRTVIRRAERLVVGWIELGGLQNSVPRKYLNRLSSLIFTLELLIHHRLGMEPPTMAKTTDQQVDVKVI
jgi:cob(I)alamin adenosyltransferase